MTRAMHHSQGSLSGRKVRRGFTLIEVLVGLSILTAGILAIATFFPYTLQAQREAEMLTLATALAQQKAEEIRRDDDRDGNLMAAIRALGTPSTPIVFPREPRLSYSFCGRSVQYAGLPATDPRAANGVARVIIRYAPDYKQTQDVIYELRFN